MNNITALIKPASYNCNLNCSYCFYCDEAKTRKSNTIEFMSEEVSDSIIDKVFDFCGNNSEISFMFQGGEPLLIGHDFFSRFSEKAVSSAPQKSNVHFSLQTNGTLIDEEYCKIFSKYNYLIGVSLDGPKELHNKYRSDSFDEVINGINLLKKNKIEFNILSVITSSSDANVLYEFCCENEFKMIQPIYCLNPLSDEKSEFSIEAKSLARFKKRFFNKWFDHLKNGDLFYVREFDNLLSYLETGVSEQCGFLGMCTPQLVIESDGTCYPCDFYCLDEFEYGNIKDINLNKIINSNKIKKFLDYDTPQNKLCDNCEVYDYCGGGCKRYRSIYNQIEGYCPQKDYLLHALSKLHYYLNNN